MCSMHIVSIVDDDESVRLATESVVRVLGWRTRTFVSAEEYLQWALAGEGATACLISDIRMPGMSGLEMHASLVARGVAPPTIFVTAFPTDSLRAQVAASGASGLLEKPIDIAALTQHLTKALGAPPARS